MCGESSFDEELSLTPSNPPNSNLRTTNLLSERSIFRRISAAGLLGQALASSILIGGRQGPSHRSSQVLDSPLSKVSDSSFHEEKGMLKWENLAAKLCDQNSRSRLLAGLNKHLPEEIDILFD